MTLPEPEREGLSWQGRRPRNRRGMESHMHDADIVPAVSMHEDSDNEVEPQGTAGAHEGASVVEGEVQESEGEGEGEGEGEQAAVESEGESGEEEDEAEWESAEEGEDTGGEEEDDEGSDDDDDDDDDAVEMPEGEACKKSPPRVALFI